MGIRTRLRWEKLPNTNRPVLGLCQEHPESSKTSFLSEQLGTASTHESSRWDSVVMIRFKAIGRASSVRQRKPLSPSLMRVQAWIQGCPVPCAKASDTFLGVPITRIVISSGLYWGPSISGNDRVCDQMLPEMCSPISLWIEFQCEVIFCGARADMHCSMRLC